MLLNYDKDCLYPSVLALLCWIDSLFYVAEHGFVSVFIVLARSRSAVWSSSRYSEVYWLCGISVISRVSDETVVVDFPWRLTGLSCRFIFCLILAVRVDTVFFGRSLFQEVVWLSSLRRAFAVPPCCRVEVLYSVAAVYHNSVHII